MFFKNLRTVNWQVRIRAKVDFYLDQAAGRSNIFGLDDASLAMIKKAHSKMPEFFDPDYRPRPTTISLAVCALFCGYEDGSGIEKGALSHIPQALKYALVDSYRERNKWNIADQAIIGTVEQFLGHLDKY